MRNAPYRLRVDVYQLVSQFPSLLSKLDKATNMLLFSSLLLFIVFALFILLFNLVLQFVHGHLYYFFIIVFIKIMIQDHYALFLHHVIIHSILQHHQKQVIHILVLSFINSINNLLKILPSPSFKKQLMIISINLSILLHIQTLDYHSIHYFEKLFLFDHLIIVLFMQVKILLS